jgi:hypothetical protein
MAIVWSEADDGSTRLVEVEPEIVILIQARP